MSTRDELDQWEPPQDPSATVGYGQPPVLPLEEKSGDDHEF